MDNSSFKMLENFKTPEEIHLFLESKGYTTPNGKSEFLLSYMGAKLRKFGNDEDGSVLCDVVIDSFLEGDWRELSGR